MGMSTLPRCTYVHHMCKVHAEARRGYRILWNCSCRWFQVMDGRWELPEQQVLMAGSLLYYFLKMLGIEFRASHMPSKCSATKLHTISPETYFLPRRHTYKCTIEIHLDICSGELAIEVNLDRGISFSFVVLSVLGIEYLDMRSWLEQPNHCPCCLGNGIAFSALIPMNTVAIRLYNPG